MSTSIPVYIVREEALRSAVGCQDSDLLEEISKKGSEHLHTIPTELSKSELLYSLIGRPPLRRALRNILWDKAGSTPTAGFYACAYELLCSHFSVGSFEDWIPVARASSWLADITSAAQTIDLDIDCTQLVFGGGLIDLSHVFSDDVSYGYWSAGQVAVYKAQVDRYLASDIFESAKDPMRDLNYPLHDISKWLNTAAQQSGTAIVAFHI
ncbi:MAG: hypothetical protein AB8B93_09685 [Pseudomonadales bacterium]